MIPPPITKLLKVGEAPARILFGLANGSEDELHRVALPGIRASMLASGLPYLVLAAGAPGENTSIFPLYEEILTYARLSPSVEILVLLHTDVELQDLGLGYKLLGLNALHRLGVAGVVGGRGQPGIRWWEGPVEGRVGWCDDNAGTPDYGYGADCRVDAVDGLLLVLTLAFLRKSYLHLHFDAETYSGFHGYDADVCRHVREAGLEVRAVPIALRHHCKLTPTGGDKALEQADLAYRRKWSGERPPAAGRRPPTP